MLREARRTSVADLSNLNGVSEQSIYTWLKQHGDEGCYPIVSADLNVTQSLE